MGLHPSKVPSEARILMLGLDGSGKSTLLYKLKYNESVVTVPTVGFNVETLETEHRDCLLTVWDVGGQHRMRTHWKHYYEDTAGLVFVIDSEDRNRMVEAKQELVRILGEESLKGLPLVVLANKQDLPGSASCKDIEEVLNLKTVCGHRQWCLQPCSARTGAGLEECFRGMLHLLRTSSLEKKNGFRDRRFCQN